MKYIILTLLISLSFTSLAQTKFEAAISGLEKELDFRQIPDTYSSDAAPKAEFRTQFETCATHENLKSFAKLNFDEITKVNYAEMDKQGKSAIVIREWEFSDEESLIKFKTILDNAGRNPVAYCMNKGGMMWWQTNNSLFFVTSAEYNTTFQYSDIRRVIVASMEN